VIGGPGETGVKRNVSVCAYREENEPAVLALLAGGFGRWPTSLDVEPGAFFRWKHMTSPFDPSIGLVAKVDGEVAGFLALMPWRLCFGGAAYKTMRGVDLAVAPDFQGLGVANALIAASRSNYFSEIALAWSNPNERSRSGVLKSGRKRVEGLPRYIGFGGTALGAAKRLFPSDPPLPADESPVVALADEALIERGCFPVRLRPGASPRLTTSTSCVGDTGGKATTVRY
jgi:GNAT superfamily N-acetyltransferase